MRKLSNIETIVTSGGKHKPDAGSLIVTTIVGTFVGMIMGIAGGPPGMIAGAIAGGTTAAAGVMCNDAYLLNKDQNPNP